MEYIFWTIDTFFLAEVCLSVFSASIPVKVL